MAAAQAQAWRAECRGDWQGAQAALQRLRQGGPTAEARAQASLRLCALAARAGQGAAARRCGAALLPQLPAANDRALLLYRLAALDPPTPAPYLRLLRTYPGTPAAQRALVMLRALARQQGGAAAEEALLRQLLTNWPEDGAVLPPASDPHALRGRIVQALLQRAAATQPEKALALAACSRELARGGNWLAPWWFWQARAHRARGDVAAAVDAYAALLRGDDAHPGAAADHHFSRFYDLALFELTQLLAQQGKEAARAAVADMRRRSPTSRYLRRFDASAAPR